MRVGDVEVSAVVASPGMLRDGVNEKWVKRRKEKAKKNKKKRIRGRKKKR